MKAGTTEMGGRHCVTLEGRARLVATGVTDVEGFDEGNVEAVTPLGILLIRGSGLKVERFSAETGELLVTGEIAAMAYSEASPRRAGLLSKLFR